MDNTKTDLLQTIREKPAKKFSHGDHVEIDTMREKMVVVSSFWEDYNPYTNNRFGGWVYQLAFLSKNGKVDNRKNYRRFDESRLTKLLKP